MGKRIKVQRRGRGTSLFRARKKGKIAPSKYPALSKDPLRGVVKDIMHEPGRGAPIAYIELGKGKGFYVPAVEGQSTNQKIPKPIKQDNIVGFWDSFLWTI